MRDVSEHGISPEHEESDPESVEGSQHSLTGGDIDLHEDNDDDSGKVDINM